MQDFNNTIYDIHTHGYLANESSNLVDSTKL
jgi:hypothetical protein